MAQGIPVRLILCVDGTSCDPDGSAFKHRSKNITNIYRFCASVQRGVSADANGTCYLQEKKYFKGIASEDGLGVSQRLRESAFGGPALQQIREVYRDCCRLGPKDEVWLYGFSRGAYVVRAVAGLLHHLRALNSADMSDEAFNKDYEDALKAYEAMRAEKQLHEGRVHHLLAQRTQPAPRIKFVGIFDTVKAVDDDHLFDISFNDSTQHLRQALALNEDRALFPPEFLSPTFSPPTSGKDHGHPLRPRSFLQAWFIGAHIDLGGSSDKDGLSLYPLQWMLLESQEAGLSLHFDGSFEGRAKMTDPLELTRLDGSAKPWECITENKVVVKMVDMRKLQSDEGGSRYAICINRPKSVFWKRKARRPFDAQGSLEGYCSFVPQGTIIHPSVYLILDEHNGTSLTMKRFPFNEELERWRGKTLGVRGRLPNIGFWNFRRWIDSQKPGAVRILVCGNTGVGKSSLINKVFGVAPGSEEPTQTSHRSRGIHDVREEIRWPGRPDLVIHDSGGFEAASLDEFKAIEDFLTEKSLEKNADKRLHAIWFCLEANNSRPTQKATERLFATISEYAQNIPVLIIATKKDEFEGIKEREARTLYKKEGRKATFEDLEEYAAAQLQLRMQQIEEEIARVEGGRFDACIAVAKDDDESIQLLCTSTLECFSNDRYSLLYIRSQVATVDLKVHLAVAETMRIYRQFLAAAASTTALPLAHTATSRTASSRLVRTVLNCFGLPAVTPDAAYQLCRAQLWDDVGNGLAVVFAESMAALGVAATAAAAGAPVFLATWALNLPVVLPATARMLLVMAADLMLVFVRAFRAAAARGRAQPGFEDLEEAVRAYRPHCKAVHARVAQRFPKRKLMLFFRVHEVKLGLTDVIEEFADVVTRDVAAAPRPRRPASDERSASTSTLDTLVDEYGRVGDGGLEGDKRDIIEELEKARQKAVHGARPAAPDPPPLPQAELEAGLDRLALAAPDDTDVLTLSPVRDL